jgi:hypothetical protein
MLPVIAWCLLRLPVLAWLCIGLGIHRRCCAAVEKCRVTVPARFNSSRNISFTAATVAPQPGSPGGAANVTSANLFSGRVSAADGTAVGADHSFILLLRGALV